MDDRELSDRLKLIENYCKAIYGILMKDEGFETEERVEEDEENQQPTKESGKEPDKTSKPGVRKFVVKEKQSK